MVAPASGLVMCFLKSLGSTPKCLLRTRFLRKRQLQATPTSPTCQILSRGDYRGLAPVTSLSPYVQKDLHYIYDAMEQMGLRSHGYLIVCNLSARSSFGNGCRNRDVDTSDSEALGERWAVGGDCSS